MGWYDDYWYYRRTTPKTVKGGIKARTRRGSFGETWWAKRWVETFEEMAYNSDNSNRLSRGRSYARSGQTAKLKIEKGMITAKVQGSQSYPYKVEINIKPIPMKNWKKIAKSISQRVYYIAKLTAGQMPADIEELFDDLDLSLFPTNEKQLRTDCSCPDWANPCKHIAAVLYLLAEEFDRDPFLIFKLRGITCDELLALIGEYSGGMFQSIGEEQEVVEPLKVQETQDTKDKEATLIPLSSDADKFWKGNALPGELPGEIKQPPYPAALPKQAGHFPFWRGDDPFMESMENIYRHASKTGMQMFEMESSVID